MILDVATLPSYKEPTAPTSPNPLPERRSSSSTTSAPPPYESTGLEPPQLVGDEKRPRGFEISYQEPIAAQPEMKRVYAEQPSAFSRVPTVHTLDLPPFDPLAVVIEGSGRSLDKGFSLNVPPSTRDIHPFALRDIQDADWARFMQALRDGTAISNCTKHKTLLVPLALGLGPGAFFISRAVKAKIRRNKLSYAINLINTWNQNFFNPRRVEVVLMRGSRPLTATVETEKLLAPSSHHSDRLSWVSMSSHYDSASSSSDTEGSIGCCSQSRIPMRLMVFSI
ncbi:hypothetical protein D9756_008441 [Leucocoprinus leucothites]|uniref:Uncharacterized protein n=1 Tax=Leucocoprinus leucothites TaxID=201217 RepID=A0A8H5D068_9AGAR|nr:hypothetical protein D9756_008441 [Leucoagaricus leucothites]